MKKLVISGLIICLLFFNYVLAADNYDFRHESMSKQVVEKISKNNQMYLSSTKSLLDQEINIEIDYSKAKRICIFDLDSFSDYVKNDNLYVGVENSSYNYYAFPIFESKDKYIIGLAEDNLFGEYVPITTEVKKTDNSIYNFILDQSTLNEILQRNNLLYPDFLAVVTIKGSITNFVYIHQNEDDFYIPFSSEYQPLLANGQVYTKSDMVYYLESLCENTTEFYGGNNPSSMKSYSGFGLFLIVTFVFFIGGAVWLRFPKKKKGR